MLGTGSGLGAGASRGARGRSWRRCRRAEAMRAVPPSAAGAGGQLAVREGRASAELCWCFRRLEEQSPQGAVPSKARARNGATRLGAALA